MKRSESILEQLQAELGFSPQLVGGEKAVLAQIERFLADAGVPGDLDPVTDPPLWGRLISEVVVPETYFFRYPESFAMLQEWIRPRLHHSLRALCMPCSTGEEAYSIAMTLREAGAASFKIEAFDASAKSVARASEGRYSIRHMRGLPETMQKQWFRLHAEEIATADAIRLPIRFEVANAFALDATSGGFDFIFCRNLLIYLNAENQRLIFERLDSWLKPGGLLFLGPGEATTASSHGWKSTGHPMSFSFVRAMESPRAAKPRSAPPKKSAFHSTPKSSPPIRQARTPRLQKSEATDWFAEAAALADAGKLPEAAQALDRFHENHEAIPASFLLRGIIEEARGARDAAEASYRKALYLEPDHLDALFHLSLLLESAGRAQSAAPLRRRIERLSAEP